MVQLNLGIHKNWFQNQIDENLRVASIIGTLNSVKFLLKNGGDVNCSNSQPLYNAISGRHTEVIKYLLLNGLKIPQHILRMVEEELDNKEIVEMIEKKFNNEPKKIITHIQTVIPI